MEEARANGDAVDGETINGMRAGLMGPIAGIGGSLVVGTLIPVLLDALAFLKVVTSLSLSTSSYGTS